MFKFVNGNGNLWSVENNITFWIPSKIIKLLFDGFFVMKLDTAYRTLYIVHIRMHKRCHPRKSKWFSWPQSNLIRIYKIQNNCNLCRHLVSIWSISQIVTDFIKFAWISRISEITLIILAGHWILKIH